MIATGQNIRSPISDYEATDLDKLSKQKKKKEGCALLDRIEP